MSFLRTSLVDVMQMGKHFSGGGYLIYDMIGVALQSLGFDTYLGIVHPEKVRLKPEEWRTLTERLVASVPPKDALVHAIEAEMTACNTSLLERSRDGFPEFTRMAYLPGYLDRERRIYLNAMCVMLDQAESRGVTSLPHSMTQPGAYDWVSGRTGQIAQMMVPNYERIGHQLSVNRARTSGMATIFGVLTFQATHGRLPAKLSELLESGIPVVDDQDFLNNVIYEVNGDKATLKVTLQTTPLIEWNLNDFWKHPWCDVSRESFVYKFGPLD